MKVIGKNGQVYDEARVVELMQNNQLFLERALLELFERQTEDEKTYKDTVYKNGRGFSASDAKILTRYALYLQSGRSLTGEHLVKAKNILPRYRRQVLSIIAEKAEK